MDQTHNPFQRLHDLLNVARGMPHNAYTLDVWASVFNVSSSDIPALVKALGELIALIDEAKSAAERFIPGDRATQRTRSAQRSVTGSGGSVRYGSRRRMAGRFAARIRCATPTRQ
jgi:hypothetical protein